jgi:hypothetical protein
MTTTNQWFMRRIIDVAPGYSDGQGVGFQKFVVPPGVFTVTAKLQGASGAGFLSFAGGRGAFVQGDIAVNPGDILWLSVGQSANYSPGANIGAPTTYGGGAGGGNSTVGGSAGGNGGGGSTAIWYRPGNPRVPGLYPDDQVIATLFAQRIMTAGGGGAAGATGVGGNAGVLGGTAGNAVGTNGGKGGTQTAGGAGVGGVGIASVTGLFGQGTTGAPNGGGGYGAGGGGGGWWGGSGGGGDTGTGANIGGGGGGSSNYDSTHVTNTSSSIPGTTGDYHGYIQLIYDLPPMASPYAPADGDVVNRQATYAFAWVYTDPDRDSHAASDFRYRLLNASTWTTNSNVSTTTLAPNSVVKYTLTATLTDGATYEWQVRSKNVNGLYSAWSDSFLFSPSSTPTVPLPDENGGIEIEVYDGVSGAYLTQVSRRIGPTWLDEDGPCAGSFTITADDPLLTKYPTLLKERNVVRVKIGSRYVGYWVITDLVATMVSGGEHSERAYKVSGEGGRTSHLPDAVVYPESVNGLKTGDLLDTAHAQGIVGRQFGFTSSQNVGNWYDPLIWLAAVNLITQANATVWNPATASGNPWFGPLNWPDGGCTWMSWAETRGLTGDQNGPTYFRYEFINPIDQSVYFALAADNTAVAYLDGNEILSVDNYNWSAAVDTKKTEPILLKAGAHVLAIVGQQIDWQFTNQVNPSGVLFSMMSASGQARIQSNSAWQAIGHPGIVPGWTVGDILQTLYQEAVARGVTSFENWLGLGFDNYRDSYGFAWRSDSSQWAFGIGAGYDAVVDAIQTAAADVWIDANMQLQAAPDRGRDRAEVYPGDTYDAMIARAMPFSYFPMATTPGSITGGTGWNWGTQSLFVAHSGASNNLYGQTMPSPGTGLATTMSMTRGQINTNDMPTGREWSIEFWAAVPVGNTFEGIAQLSGSTQWFSLDIQDAKDASTGATITGLQQVLLSFADLDNAADGLTRTSANYLVDVTAAHYYSEYVDFGAYAEINVYRNNQLIIKKQLKAGHSNTSLGSTGWYVQNSGRNAGDTPTAAVLYQRLAMYQRRLTEEERIAHYRAGLGAFNPVTNPVIFNVAKNVLAQGNENTFRAKTALMVNTSEDSFEAGADARAVNQFGRIEGFYDASQLASLDAAEVTSHVIANGLAEAVSTTVDVMGKYVPWRDFQVGDWVFAPASKSKRRNLLPDSSFEFGGPTGGFVLNCAAQVVTSPYVGIDGGTWAKRVTFTAQAAGAAYSFFNREHAATIIGRTYRISYYVATPDGTRVQIWADVNNGDTTSGAIGVWERISVVFVATMVETQFGIRNAATVANGKIVYIDCILFEEADQLEPYIGDLTPGVAVDQKGIATFEYNSLPEQETTKLARRRIASIAVAEDGAGNPVYSVELDTISQDDDRRFSKWISRTTPDGSLNGVIPKALGA